MRSCRTPGKDSAPYRAEKRREREREEQVARDILADPESTDEDQNWARSVISPASAITSLLERQSRGD